MKKNMALFFMLLLAFSLYGSVYVLGDLSSFDAFFLEGTRVDVEAGFSYKELQITFPIRYGKSDKEDLRYVETGVLVNLHPVEGTGLFVEVSFLKAGWMWGIYAPEDQLLLSSEGSVGWDLKVSHLYLKPKLTFRNTLSSEMDRNECLKVIPQFSSCRFSCLVGVCL